MISHKVYYENKKEAEVGGVGGSGAERHCGSIGERMWGRWVEGTTHWSINVQKNALTKTL